MIDPSTMHTISSMRYPILAGILAIMTLPSCGGPSAEQGIPESPQERLALLDEKRTELAKIQNEIAQLEKLLGDQANAGLPEKPRLVTTTVLTKTTFRRFSEIQGNVTPVRSNAISSETGGRLLRVNVKAGDAVKAGQLLASVDMEPLQKQLQEVESAYSLASDIFDRQKRLWDQKIGSELQFLQAKNNKERLEKSLESIKSQLRKANIYAPISGVIDELLYQQGDVAPPGMPIMRLVNTNDLKVVAEVPERYVGTVKQGDPVEVKVQALGITQQARVTVAGKVVHPTNRTFRIETSLNNSGGAIKPNLLALVYIEDYREENAMVVSVDLVQEEVGGKKFVFVKEEGERGFRAKKVYVTTGESHNNQIVIKDGLKPGDELIVLGARGLKDSDLLEIRNDSTSVQ